MSGNGRWIAFASRRNDLVAGDTEDAWDVFVRDTVANSTLRISQTAAGAGLLGASTPTLTPDGRFLAYRTGDTLPLTAAPVTSNGYAQVVVHDRDSDHDGVFDEVGAVSDLVLPESGDLGIAGDYGSGSVWI